MTKGRHYMTMLLITVIAFGAGIFLGMRDETQATLLLSGPEDMPTGVDLDPVWKAWRILQEKHVPATTTAPLSEQDRVWGMVEGLAAAYGDPYTVFFPPVESESFEQELMGTFGGVGIEIGMRDDILTVIAPLKGTPGEAAGLRSGDFIVEVDGESTRTMSIDEAIRMIRGEIGTTVVLTIAREGESEFLEVPVVRDVIEIPTIETELRDDGIFVLSLYNFGGTALREVQNALREVVASESSALLIDVRGNPGGFLDTAVEFASYLLPLGKVVVIEDYGDEEKRYYRSKGYDVGSEAWRIAVLIDGGSASASEILAGALQDHERAVLIGAETFGKGSVQELVDITPKTSMKVTVSRWLTPNGVSLSSTGLTPTLEVPMTREHYELDEDPQFDAAIEYLTTGVLPTIAAAIEPVTTASSTASTTAEQ